MNWKALAKVSTQLLVPIVIGGGGMATAIYFWGTHGALAGIVICGGGIVVFAIAALYKLEVQQKSGKN